MKRNVDRLRGTAQVFSFTLRQFFKSRANLISLVVMLVMVMASMPLVTWMQGREIVAETAEAAQVWVDNRTQLQLPAQTLRDDPYWAQTEFTAGADGDVVVTVDGGAQGYTIAVTGASERDRMALENAFFALVDAARLSASGMTEQQLAVLYADYLVNVPAAEETPWEDAPEEITVDGDGLMDGFWVQYGYAIVVMMLCLLSSSYVIRAVVEEKSSRLVELLLLSVEPLALLLGKILGAMVYVLALLAVMIAGWFGSLAITAALFGSDAVAPIVTVLTSLLPSQQADGLQLVLLAVVLVVSLLLGYLTMSILGGLSGAGCSNTEEMGAANSTVLLLTMAGYIGACAFGAMPGRSVALVTSLCPVLSLFCAPVRYLQGDISLAVLLLSWLIQLGLIAALAWLASRVYAQLIIHRGSRIKMRQLLGMARKEAA